MGVMRRSRTADDALAEDGWRTLTTGGRVEWSARANAFTLDGKITGGGRNALWLDSTRLPQLVPFGAASNTLNGHVLGAWTRSLGGGRSFRVQSFLDATRRTETIGSYGRRTLDVDAEYHGAIGRRHDLVVGGECPLHPRSVHGTAGWTLSEGHQHDQLVNVFAQDEIALVPSRLALSLGAKVERDTIAGVSDATIGSHNVGRRPPARSACGPRARVVSGRRR
jgi:iron complex outermembrane receptor protein